MNKQSPRTLRGTAQAGFTLIELIVVIVILGILAATALPKFADMGGDARLATVKAAKGALEATSAMAHGRYLIAPGTAVALEGTTISMTNNYPTAGAAFAAAAGLTATDWIIILPSKDATDNTPATAEGELAIVPQSLAGNAHGLTCFVKYTQAASGGSPKVEVTASSTGC